MNKESNAQDWELNVVCKNKKYMKAIIEVLIDIGSIDYEVETVDYSAYADGDWDSRYVIYMSSCWFSNLAPLTKKLSKIEKKFEKF